jgi:predicted transcriptional regulator YheO
LIALDHTDTFKSELQPPTQVEITLHDKTKLKGFVQKIAEDHFVVRDLKTAAVTNVAYTQVKQVKHVKDHHLSERQLTVIATVIILGLAVWASSSNIP